jgi:hypothetical protein
MELIGVTGEQKVVSPLARNTAKFAFNEELYLMCYNTM